MKVLERLSSSRGESDNSANIALAEELAAHPNKLAIRELVEHMGDKDRRLASDCVKTLYELGERKPELIAPYIDDFVPLLTNKNQRLVWGAMCALDAAASADANAVFPHLQAILKAADGDSVIARDHCVDILTKLCSAGHTTKCFPIILDIIRDAPLNQLPSYCEKAVAVVPANQKNALAALIRELLATVEQKPKRTRMEKVLKKLG